MDSPVYRYILHLSDLHFTSPHAEMRPYGTPRFGRTERPQQDRFKQLELALLKLHLGAPFEYVIVSGDITDRHNPDGFGRFKDFIDWMIAGRLCHENRKRILVVPGNHDVLRPKTFTEAELADAERYRLFERSCRRFTRPSLAWSRLHYDFERQRVRRGQLALRAKTRNDAALLDSTVFVDEDAQRHEMDGPFVCDSRLGLLLYLFDSAQRTGAMQEVDDDERRAMITRARRLLTTLNDTDRRFAADLTALVGLLEERQFWDWSEIDWGQTALMDEVCAGLPTDADTPPDHWFRLAVVHHHVGDIPSNEYVVQPYDRLVNANQFKRHLLDAGFAGVIHGHRHIPCLTYDTGVRDGFVEHAGDEGLWLISGGTIGGLPAGSYEPTFVLLRLELDQSGRACRAAVRRVGVDTLLKKGRFDALDESRYVSVWERPDVRRPAKRAATRESRLFSQLDIGLLSMSFRPEYVRRVEEVMTGGLAIDEIVKRGEAIRWDLLGRLQQSTVERFKSLGLECIFNELESIEKDVRFTAKGNFNATTNYHDLHIDLEDREPKLVSIPIHVTTAGRSRLGGGKRLQIRVEQLLRDGAVEEIPEQEMRRYPSPVGEKVYFKLRPSEDAPLSYRMTYRSRKPFHLSRAETDELYRPERRRQPETWNRHHNALEVTQTCHTLRLALHFPRETVQPASHFDDRDNFGFVVWPSGGQCSDAAVTDRDRILRGIGLTAEDWTLSKLEKGKYISLVLEIRRGLKVGFHYGILWRPPSP